MAKEYIFLKGKVKWFRHIQPDASFGGTPKWKHQLYIQAEDLPKIKELQAQGVKNHLKKDDDGYYMNFSRVTQIQRRDGKIVGLDPPLVTMAGSDLPLRDTMVGNGSDVTDKIEVYSHGTPGGGKAKALRWEGSRIDHLVPFDTRKDYDEGEAKQLKGLPEQPAPLF